MFLRKSGRLVVRRGTNRIEPTSPLIINKNLEYSFNLEFRLTNRPAELYNVRKKNQEGPAVQTAHLLAKFSFLAR